VLTYQQHVKHELALEAMVEKLEVIVVATLIKIRGKVVLLMSLFKEL